MHLNILYYSVSVLNNELHLSISTNITDPATVFCPKANPSGIALVIHSTTIHRDKICDGPVKDKQ